MRVCVLAHNSVLHDGRILKEADSLAQAGHEVSVIGLGDNRVQAGQYERASGARIHLLDIKAVTSSQALRLFVTGTFSVLLLAALLLLVLAVDRRDLLEENPLLILPIALLGSIPLLLQRHIRRTGVRLLKRLLRVDDRVRQFLMVSGAARLQPEILHCHDLMTLPAGQRAKAKTGAALIWDAHEIYEEVAQANDRMRKRYRRLLTANQFGVDGFVTINDSIAGFYARHYRHLPPAIIVKNATVPVGPVLYDGRLHEAAGLPRTQRIVLYQGGFAEKRGLQDVVSAARYIDPSWTLVMMGWGRLEDTLREIAAQVTAATPERALPAVVMIPAVPQAELTEWTAGAEIGLIPYERIGLNHLYCTPNKLWEYPNATVPILCSPLEEMSKVIEKYGVGWLLPEEATPQAIAERINSITDEELKHARRACRAYIAADNWFVYERRLVDMYASLSSACSKACAAAREQTVSAP